MSNAIKLDASRLDEENPKWTREEVASASSAAEVLPGLIGTKATEKLLRAAKAARAKKCAK